MRSGERRLLDEALARVSTDPQDLTPPTRVVVPSQSLRLHLASRIVEAAGRAVLGLRVQTLSGLALEVLDRSGVAAPDSALLPVLVRRLARREPRLVEGLEPLVEGYAAVVNTVDDLLDAGFEALHAPVLEEQLAAQPAAPGAVARAQAVVRVAAGVSEALASEKVGHRSRSMALARECLERDPALLPSRGLLVYGFADATGVQADLIEALLRRDGARLLLDSGLDPTAREPRRAGPRFGAAFRERLGPPGAGAGEAPRPQLVLLRAPAPMAEVRAVAERLRGRLDAGAVPERLAVVARDLAPYRVALRVQLRRLCVPFSGAGEPGAATPARRRLLALLALVELGEDAAMEPWLAARADLRGIARADRHHAFHRRGALRLDEVARFAAWPADQPLELDVRRGLLPEQDGRPARAPRRALPGDALAAEGRAAASLLRRLRSRPGRAPAAEHLEWLSSIADHELGWRRGTPERDALEGALPPASELDAEEFDWLMRQRLEHAGLSALGGEGGGVQVLSVVEARARSFDELFVLGMRRGGFPRVVHEDPLLPDPVRARLREVLPGIPVKREGVDEERFLFAQLLSAAPRVTLSWPETNEAGRPQPSSPLLESLERGGRVEHEVAPPLHAPRPATPALPPRERALLAGLHGSRQQFAEALAGAVAECGPAPLGRSAASLTAARLAVLDEIDADPARRRRLGPYFGFVGEVRDPADPRRTPLFVTRLEDVARCPWQAFLSRVLRLAPAPDAADRLPAADDRRLLGNLVHRVLERIAHREPSPRDGDPLRREPQPAPWPDDETLDAWLLECAADELRDEANPLPGYARVLAQRARPYLERARGCDWGAGPPSVVGTELQSVADVLDAKGERREIAFKADRVDRTAGGPVLTDYKTGKPIAPQKRAAARSEQLRHTIASGRSLQAMLYARAGGEGARGRYLFLAERVPEEARSLEAVDEAPFAEPFDAALRTLLEVWDRGSFLPRLVQADRDEEPSACRFCDVKEACLRGDSGARLRLETWFEDATAQRGAAEQAAAAVFSIGTERR